MSDIRIGDRVRVTAGMHAGAVGVVVEELLGGES
jgi:ribosomal protein L24